MRKRFIWEADGDEGSDGGTNENQATANTNDNTGSDNNDADNAGDDNSDNTDDNNDDSDEEEQEPSDDDFTINTDDADEDSGDDEGSDDSSDSSIDSSSDSTDEPSAEEDAQNDQSMQKDILAKEKEIFATLSPAEQRIKNKELKILFKNLYMNCAFIMDKINDLGSDIQSATPQLKRTVTILFQIKQSIYDYLFNLYDSKGYIENKRIYYVNLAMLNQVKKVLVKINDSYSEDIKEA